MELTERKESIKARCKEITDIAKAEIRELTEAEEREISDAKKELENINQEMREMEEKEKEAPEKEEVKEKEETEDEVKEDEKTEETEEVTNDENPENDEESEEEKNENKENNKRSINTKITMKQEFRLLNAIRDIANNRNLDSVSEAVNERGKAEAMKAGMTVNGQIQLPLNEMRDITVASEGADVVEVDMYNILEPLRAKNVLMSAGAKFLTGLIGNIQLPSMTAGNVYWENEVSSAKDAGQKFDHIKLEPHRLTAFVEISKQFLVQDSLSAENLIRQDLINAINSKLESTVLGTEEGSATQPAGIFYTTGETPTISDFKGICELESGIEDANVFGECKYVMSNKAKAAFRNMAKSTKSTELVFQNGTIDGTPVLNTSNVAEKNLAYGDFSQLYIGQWGAIDLLVDPYTKSKEGKIVLVVSTFFDAKVVRPDAIKTAKVA